MPLLAGMPHAEDIVIIFFAKDLGNILSIR